MVVGQQKLKGSSFHTSLNTKMIQLSQRICDENIRHPHTTVTHIRGHNKLKTNYRWPEYS